MSPSSTKPLAVQAGQILRAAFDEAEIEWEEARPGLFIVSLPGEKKLKTACTFEVGGHTLGVHAFIARRADENHADLYRWMLERNLKMYGVAFALDHAGDMHLVGRLPLAAVTEDEVDRLLGSVLEYADRSFNTILELGFGSSILREWRWRQDRGESTANLTAFRGWIAKHDREE